MSLTRVILGSIAEVAERDYLVGTAALAEAADVEIIGLDWTAPPKRKRKVKVRRKGSLKRLLKKLPKDVRAAVIGDLQAAADGPPLPLDAISAFDTDAQNEFMDSCVEDSASPLDQVFGKENERDTGDSQ